jgi:hypothetical protein
MKQMKVDDNTVSFVAGTTSPAKDGGTDLKNAACVTA